MKDVKNFPDRADRAQLGAGSKVVLEFFGPGDERPESTRYPLVPDPQKPHKTRDLLLGAGQRAHAGRFQTVP